MKQPHYIFLPSIGADAREIYSSKAEHESIRMIGEGQERNGFQTGTNDYDYDE